jgi:hypothetical protein
LFSLLTEGQDWICERARPHCMPGRPEQQAT